MAQTLDFNKIRRIKMLQDDAMKLPDLGYVVSGMSGRFPKSDTINELEENLITGVDMISDNDDSRYDCGLWGLPKRAGRIKDLSKFDCEFFGYTAEEASLIDLQLRVLYETVYESIMDAGVNPASLRGTRTGVFLGLHANETEMAIVDNPKFIGDGHSLQFATKLAHFFDLRGYTAAYDTACSSGFTALYSAILALDEGLIDQAIVCAVNIPVSPSITHWFLKLQMLSPTGYSRFLDSSADGYVKGEACVSIFIQRKQSALRNYASFMAVAANVDGYKPEGITFPKSESQMALIRYAKEKANISINHIEYMEAHGTGTPAGDPQEANSISSVYYPEEGLINVSGEETDGGKRTIGPLLVGSLKTNIGHGEAASGLSSLVKVVLMLENEIIYRNLHFEKPNPNIPSLLDGRLKLVTETMELKGKIIPLSCYGFGGANVNVIVRANEQPMIDVDECNAEKDESARLILMFGRSKAGLNSMFDHIMNTEGRNTRNCLTYDFLFLLNSLNTGPMDRLMNYRGYLVVDWRKKLELAREIKKCDLKQFSEDLLEQGSQLRDSEKFHPQRCEPRKVNLIIPGLNTQWPGSAAGLCSFKPFWSTVERLQTYMEPYDVDITDLLTNPDTKRLDRASHNFVLIIGYAIALIHLIRDQLKVEISGIVGHSLGEIACAYAAGVYDERETILMAYHLGEYLDANKHIVAGKMVAINMSEEEAHILLEPHQIALPSVRIACINGPQAVTLSGRKSDMEAICAVIRAKGLKATELQTNGLAVHNDYLYNEDLTTKLIGYLTGKVLYPLTDYPRLGRKWHSSVGGMQNAEQANARYFAECVCRPTKFNQALDNLADDSITLEISQSDRFASLIYSKVLPNGEEKFHHVSLMQRNTKAEHHITRLLTGIGQLYQAGASFDLNEFYSKQRPASGVRRKTPSISSLLKWDHTHSLFVPRYSVEGSKSVAKSEISIDLMGERDKYLSGHCIDGRILYPAAAYLFQVWRMYSFVKRGIFDTTSQSLEQNLVPIEFIKVRLSRAVILTDRETTVHVNLDVATGKFELLESGSIVCEGYVRAPVERPLGLLYEDVCEMIKEENLELNMSANDVYKQMRVNGYDYEGVFRGIEKASSDGRYSRVRFNEHFIALIDCIMQSICLKPDNYSPAGGLFLPTSFDYVRFQPEIILAKIHASNLIFDRGEEIDVIAHREASSKTMMLEGMENRELEKRPGNACEPEKLPCYFDSYSDQELGIIVSDGIEFRGIKAASAQRRDNTDEVLLESYQFIRDIEDPIDDERLTKFIQVSQRYTQHCDALAFDVLSRFCRADHDEIVRSFLQQEEAMSGRGLLDAAEIYKENQLASKYTKAHADSTEQAAYDVRKNGDLMLLSVLDQLQTEIVDDNAKLISEILQRNRSHLMRDLITNSMLNERLLRPTLETVLENSHDNERKICILEINPDDVLMRETFRQLITQAAPNITLDYLLAHPDAKKVTKQLEPSDETYTLNSMLDLKQNFFAQSIHLKELDLIAYKDTSCYSLIDQNIGHDDIGNTIRVLNDAVKPDGFVMVLMRNRLTLAEGALSVIAKHGTQSTKEVYAKIENLNQILASRCNQVQETANQSKMICVAKRSDLNGCLALLYRCKRCAKPESSIHQATIERVLLKIEHDDPKTVQLWLEDLKAQFRTDETSEEKEKSELEDLKGRAASKQVWLCAVATKQQPISGVVGLMQALGKELGLERIRCYYDLHTFKNSHESVNLHKIEQCLKFQEALRRDMVWNCVDSDGNFGSYRHININRYLDYEQSLCSNQNLAEKDTIDQLPVSAYIKMAHRGDLSSFAWHETPYAHMEDRSSICRVAYSALNFRDVMLATGKLSLDAVNQSSPDLTLGLEFAGVDSFGRRVAGMVSGRAIGTHVDCPRERSVIMRVPDWMPLKDAATVPVVYGTVIMAIVYRGRAIKGESILIHAGSGGVGQAAIVVSHHLGLEIYTTCGTDDKRRFLLEEFGHCLTNDRIFSSRTCDFEAEILRATNGRGVDLVLNSLSDDKLLASLRCLADGGRFLEIGKYDMSIDSKLELNLMVTNKTFHSIQLDLLFANNGDAEKPNRFIEEMRRTYATVEEWLDAGILKPIRYRVFSCNEVEEAFRYMAGGKHIGKILIEINGKLEQDSNRTRKMIRSVAPTFQLSPLKSYIVTGGLGGFGLELTKWLVSKGARHLLLTSRKGIKSGYQCFTLERLEASCDAKIHVITEDTADTTCMGGVEILCNLAIDASPIKQIGGIFHLAMVLRDCLLENMTAEAFDQVCKPKLDTGFFLDRWTREQYWQRPDYFVVFSSVSSGKGNAGQANYAYANSCLERLCERRRARGEHGIAIQWGAVGDVGVAFEQFGGNNIMIGGTVPQRMPSCLATLNKLLCSPFAVCLSVLPASGDTEELGGKKDLVASVSRVLGIKDLSKVSRKATLDDLGLDSLMAVEVRQLIEREYDETLNMQQIRKLTLEKIHEISKKGKTTTAKPAAPLPGKAVIKAESYADTAVVKHLKEKASREGAARKVVLVRESAVELNANQA